MKLELPPKGLASKIKVTVPVDTRIVSISVTDRAPEEASRIANSLREVAAQKDHQRHSRFGCDNT